MYAATEIGVIFLVVGVTIKFTRKAYNVKEGEAAVPEIVVSAGDVTEPITIR